MGSLLRALAPYAMAGSGTPKPPFPVCAPSEPVSCAFRDLLRSIIDKPVGRPVEHNAESLVVCCSLVHSLPKASIRSPTRRRPCFGESLPAHSLNSLTSSPTRLISDRFPLFLLCRVDMFCSMRHLGKFQSLLGDLRSARSASIRAFWHFAD